MTNAEQQTNKLSTLDMDYPSSLLSLALFRPLSEFLVFGISRLYADFLLARV